nr:PREDICTED: uncharacterized protein LOC103313445 [Tribolium castaneum]|eukprot:XP_015836571.1 PREDICTED: uncharacterized protein LOC103313445 [Tribolium castaneum]
MPNFCMVVNCGSVASRDVNIRFFRIPSIFTPGKKLCALSQRRREMWIKALRREDLTDTKMKYGRICSRHFHSGKPAALKDTTHPDWVPSKNMGYNVTGKKIRKVSAL